MLKKIIRNMVKKAVVSAAPRSSIRATIEPLEGRLLLTGLNGTEYYDVPDDMLTEAYVFVGDHSTSNSEQWTMLFGSEPYGGAAQAPGEITRAKGQLKRGQDYPVSISHFGTNRVIDGEKKPDYDLRSWIDDSATPAWTDGQKTPIGKDWFTDDPDGVLSKRFFGSDTDPTKGAKPAWVYVPGIDLDIDSDNDGTLDRSLNEDRLETTTGSGKSLFATEGDVNHDGVSGDDGDWSRGIAGGAFAVSGLTLSPNIEKAKPTSTTVRLNYDDSLLRVWRSDAAEVVANGVTLDAASLGLVPGSNNGVTLYVEALKGSATPRLIDAEVNVTGSVWSGTLTDQIRVKPQFLKSLTVYDTQQTNRVKVDKTLADDAPRLFVEEQEDGTASITLDPDIVGGDVYSPFLWAVEGETVAGANTGMFAAGAVDLTLTPSVDSQYFTIKTGPDFNRNGVLDVTEVSRHVNVTAVRFDSAFVQDAALPSHSATASSSDSIEYFVMPDANGQVNLNLDAFGAPETPEAGKEILWTLSRLDKTSPVDGGDFGGSKDPSTVLKPGSTRQTRSYTLKLGFDDNDDAMLDQSETTRRIQVNVVFPIDVQITSFIPYEWVHDPSPDFQTVYGMEGAYQLYRPMIYGGDDRMTMAGLALFNKASSDYRTRQKVKLIPVVAYDLDGTGDGLDTKAIQNLIGTSHQYLAGDSLDQNDRISAAAKADTVLGDFKLLHAVGTATNSGMSIVSTISGGLLSNVNFITSATNPLEPPIAPSIDYNLDLALSYTNPRSASYHLTGQLDGFPAYEFYLDSALVYSLDPIAEGQTPLSLGGTGEFYPDKTGNLVLNQ